MYTRLLSLFCLLSSMLCADDLKLPVHGLTRNIQSGEVHAYTLNASGGDLITGALNVKGMGARAVVYDPGNRKARTAEFTESDSSGIGFLAQSTGTYRLEISANEGTGSGLYTLSLRRDDLQSRMRGQHAEPRDTYISDRISRLKREISEGSPGLVDAFWQEAAKQGGPILEPDKTDKQHLLVTFLWKETFPTSNVLLSWRGPREEDYYMSRVPGTNVWYKTIRVRQGSRFLYRMSVNDRPNDRDFTSVPDPLNPRHWPDAPDASFDYVGSVLELPGAPDERWFREVPEKRGKIRAISMDSALLKSKVNIRVYTPPEYDAAAGPYPLVIFLDGTVYLSNISASVILDNLIAAGKIRPAVAVFIDRSRSGFGRLFADAVATEIVPWLQSNNATSRNPKDILICGWSLGGVHASYLALWHPGVFGNVLSQSGAFRNRDTGSLEPNSTAEAFVLSPRLPVRFYLDAGLYDNVPDLPMYELALDEGNTQGNRHFRDVLRAKGYEVTYRETGGGHNALHWRATLPEGLMALLPKS